MSHHYRGGLLGQTHQETGNARFSKMAPLNFMKLCVVNVLMYEYVHSEFQLGYRPFLFLPKKRVTSEYILF